MKRDFRQLDGLRGLASLMVVFSHYSLGFLPILYGVDTATKSLPFLEYVYSSPLTLIYSGNFAVTTFFVLSGFVLSLNYLKTLNSDLVISIASRRYLRLMLPALVSVLITYLFLKFDMFRNSDAAKITGSFAWLGSFWNFEPSILKALLEGTYGSFFGTNYTYNSSLWTMKIELFGSFLVFALLLLTAKLPRRWVVYLLLSLLLIKTYYLAFIIGVVLADIWINSPTIKKSLQSILFPIAILGLFFATWSSVIGMGSGKKVWPFSIVETEAFFHILGSTALIICTLSMRNLKRFFMSRLLQFMGKISFSLYLIHLLILGSLGSWLFVSFFNKFGYSTAILITLPASILFTLFIAWIYTICIDDTGQKIAKRVGLLITDGASDKRGLSAL